MEKRPKSRSACKTARSIQEQNPKPNSNYSYGQILVSSLKPKEEQCKTFHETNNNNSKHNKKKHIYDFYIDILRRLELIKFSIKNPKNNEKLTDSSKI